MAYKHVIRAKTKNLMTDEMFTSAGFTKQPDGSWYVPNSTVLHNKVLWENTEGTVRKIFTPTRPGYFDRITYFNPPGNHFSGDYIFRVQLEQGSTATSYVPYQHL